MLTMKEIIRIFYNALLQKLKNHRGNWNQNDPTADDYIKNRPFYTDESVRNTIIPKQQVDMTSSPFAEFSLTELIEFVIGQTYEVLWDNKAYECVAFDLNGMGAIGNQGILGNGIDTGETCTIAIYKAENLGMVIGETGTHTVEVTGIKVVTLDKKYIPDLGLATVAYTGSYNNLSDTPTIYSDTVRYGSSQSLSTAQKKTAKTNIGAVGYDSAQSLTTANKTQARTNIGAVGYESQTLTDAQKTQARTNIGAGTSSFSGSYNDLTDAPALAKIATSGSYFDLEQRLGSVYGKKVAHTQEYREGSVIYYTDNEYSDVKIEEKFDSAIRKYFNLYDSTSVRIYIHPYDNCFAVIQFNNKMYQMYYKNGELYRAEQIYIDDSKTIPLVASDSKAVTYFNNGSNLAVGTSQGIKIYNITNGYMSYLSDVYMDNTQTAFDGEITVIKITSDNTWMAVGGAFTGKVKLYRISGTSFTYIQDVASDENGTIFKYDPLDIAFLENQNLLLIGAFSTKAIIAYTYSTENSTATYIGSAITNTMYVNNIVCSKTRPLIYAACTNKLQCFKYSNGSFSKVFEVTQNSCYTLTISPNDDYLVVINSPYSSGNGKRVAVYSIVEDEPLFLFSKNFGGNNTNSVSDILYPISNETYIYCGQHDANRIFYLSYAHSSLLTEVPKDILSYDIGIVTENPNISYHIAHIDNTGLMSSIEQKADKTELEQKADKSDLEKLNTPKSYFIMIDQVSGITYHVAMRDGNLISYAPIESISVTQMPDKVTYTAGEYFDPTGMIVSSVMTNGTVNEITEYTIDEQYVSNYLTDDVTEVTISYTDGDGIVHTTTVPITVNPFDPETMLVDFEYTANEDGTYTLTGWKQTLNGEASTEMIVPDNPLIVL